MSYKKDRTTLKGALRYAWMLLFLVAGVTLATLELTNVTHFFHKKHVTYTPTPTTGGGSANTQKGEPQPSNSGADSSNSSQPGDNKSNTGGTGAALVAPTGDFVSAHGSADHPITLSTPITSVCNTTPGASCQITFTKDGVSQPLPSQATDRGGTTYWNNWTPKQYGLTPGSWQIQATATLNGQTKTTTDIQVLVVTS